MTNYTLRGDGRVRVAGRPLRVHLSLAPGLSGHLEAWEGGQPLPESRAVRPPGSGMLILPEVTNPAVIRIAADPGQVFPAGAHAHVTVLPGQDGIQVDTDPADLAGLSVLEVLRVDPVADSGVEVRMATDGQASSGQSLEGLAAAARMAVTEILGTQAVDPTVALNIVAAVDESVSVRTMSADVAAALEVLDGVASVVAPSHRVGIALVGDGVTVHEVPSLAGAFRGLDAGRVASSGATWGSAALERFAPDGSNTMTYVLTDAVPAEVRAVEAADQVPGEARHLVVLEAPGSQRLQPTTSLPTTSVAVGTGATPLSERLVREPRALGDIVRSLLIGCFPPGTAEYAKVGGR